MVDNRCKYINDIKGCSVVKVYEFGHFIELCYLKGGMEKSFTIEQRCHFGPMDDGCWFDIGGVELPSVIGRDKKILSTSFTDIDIIEDINYYCKAHDNNGYCDLEISYKAKDGHTKSYLLHPQSHEEEVHEIVLLNNRKSTFNLEKCDDSQIPKELYSTKIYKDALAFALEAHGEQKTPEGLPYAFHIVSVANEIINSLSMHKIPHDEANVAITCALLHDVNEDTEEEVSKYTIEFPSQNVDIVIQGVAALTKDETLPSKQEQMKDSLTRLKQMPNCVQMVKLADRITNLAPAPLFWNKIKRKAYLDEAKFILRELGKSNKYLADKLQYKIDNYLVDSINDNCGVKVVDDYLVFIIEDKQLILDKSHKKYLKTFKALNRLNEHVSKEYDLKLFESWNNKEKEELKQHVNKVSISYIMKILNSKDLLNLNLQPDEKIDRYFTIILDAEEAIL